MSFFTFSLIYLCKLESQKVFVHFTDVLDLPAKEMVQKGFYICHITDLFILLAGDRLTKREASDPDPHHPMKHEITRFIMFYAPEPRTKF